MARPRGSYDGITPVGGYPTLTRDDGHFLAGFLDGEACFVVNRAAGGYACSCSVAARRDDRQLLEQLKCITGLGSVTDRRAQGNASPQSAWTIKRKADCFRLAELTRNFPLRGRKRREAELWSTAVGSWCAGDPSRRVKNRDWTVIALIEKQIKKHRKYVARIGRSESASN